MWSLVPRSPGCIARYTPSSKKPERVRRRWGHICHAFTTWVSQNGTSTETERWWNTNMGTSNLSLAKAMLPLLRTSALTLFNLTHSLSFYLKLEPTTTMALVYCWGSISVPESLGCSHWLMLHPVTQEHTQLNKTLFMHRALRGWWDLSQCKVLCMPLSCPSAAQPAQKQCMFWNGTLMHNSTVR